MARVTSIYKALKYVVMCQPAGQAFFEPIAAFNHDGVAIDYARDCLKGKPIGFRYRVEERKNNEPKCIYRSDAPATARVVAQ